MSHTTLNNLTCPTGTLGIAVEPWSKGEIYAVAANWAQASSPVLSYGADGWTETGRQVADYRHSERAALEAVIIEAIAASEGIASEDVNTDEVDAILDDAVEVSDDE